MTATRNEIYNLIHRVGTRPIYVNDITQFWNKFYVITWSWGMCNTQYIYGKDNECMGFAFKVNGLLHKGWVVVTLNGRDLFDIYLTKPVLKFGSLNTATPTKSNVYIEDFIFTLDTLIETPKEETTYEYTN